MNDVENDRRTVETSFIFSVAFNFVTKWLRNNLFGSYTLIIFVGQKVTTYQQIEYLLKCSVTIIPDILLS